MDAHKKKNDDVVFFRSEGKLELELLDWKNIEKAARQQIREGMVMVECGYELLNLAVRNICAMGGKTADEELRERKEQA